MRLNYNQFLAVVYGDVFDWPLTREEARIWAIAGEKYKIQDTPLRQAFAGQARHKIQERKQDRGRRERLAKIRKLREKVSKKKFLIAIEITEILEKIPMVQGIFLTGSVVVGNAKEEADIDLMIVTKPGTLWLTRFWVFGLLRSLKLLRSLNDHENKVCPNIFLDTNNLEIKERNLYTAHEVLQAKCLFDRGGIETRWLEENEWTRKCLPNAYSLKVKQESKSQDQFPISNKPIFNLRIWNLGIGVHWSWLLGVLIIFEPLFFLGQYLYMRDKMTNESIGWGFAFFHPRQLGEIVEEKFWRRLIKYSR